MQLGWRWNNTPQSVVASKVHLVGFLQCKQFVVKFALQCGCWVLLSTRLTEHKRAARNGGVNNNIAEHHLQTKHQIDWDYAHYQRLTLESRFLTLNIRH